MTESSPFPRRSLSRFGGALLFLLLGAVAVPSLQAADCVRTGCGRLTRECGGFPAKPAPADRWTDLQAVDNNPLPSNRDSTNFDQSGKETTNVFDFFNWFMSVDVENGYLIGALAHGVQIWDVRTTPASPVLLAQYKGGYAGLNNWPVWVNDPHIFYPLYDVDAPAGKDSTAAIVGEGGVGLAIFDLTDKTTPRLTYQNHKKDMRQVYAATIGGVDYAFGAAYQGEPSGGLYAYNMTAAKQYTHCAEAWPASGEAIECPGVYVGKFGTLTNVYYVDGVDNFVVTSSGASRGFEILDFSIPSSPVQKLKGLTNQSVYGVALWRDGSSYYLGAISDSALNIYNVSCIASACTGLGGPIATVPMSLSTREELLTFSRSGATPYLYVGSDDNCRSGSPQREFLFDVSDPTSPRSLGGQTYFDWYYRGSATGFNRVAPRTAKFSNDYLYRAGLSILDIHKLAVAGPPSADFSFAPAGGGTEIYPGTPVNFTDKSSGGPASWTWTFPGGTPSSSTNRNPTGVTFNPTSPFPATVQVTLQAGNASGSNNITKSLQILDPNPQVQNVSASPSAPLKCQPVTFTATATGKPNLTYTWTISTKTGVATAQECVNPNQGQTGGVILGPTSTGTTKTFTWSTSGVSVGPDGSCFRATADVKNGDNVSTSAVKDVWLAALPPLPTSFAPTNDPFAAGTVKFHVVAAGATEWNWDFGDGTSTGWTNDPVNGPNPTHTYTTIGTRNVTVKVRNCAEGEKTSSVLQVSITQTEPLTASFQFTPLGSCIFGCPATVNQPVTFEDNSTGAETWEFDWKGDGFGGANGADDQTVTSSAFTTVGSKRQITHTYTTTGTVIPQLRVHRGSEVSEAYIHRQPIVVGTGGGGPVVSISVSGPGTGKVNTAYTFSASATGCTASDSGWTWDTGGGTIAGGANGATISVSWSGTGVKSVQATNSGCAGVQGSKTISITSDNPGPDPGAPLAASFSWTPPAPKAGEAVSFNGSSSTGSPEGYEWSFGDNTPNSSGAITSHTFAAAGTYNVRLSVRKQGTGPACLFNVCIAETIKQVTVIPSNTTPTLNPDYTVDAAATCENQFGFVICKATTGKAVTFTAIEADAAYAWNFGDGQTATGRVATHTWSNPGPYGVALTVTKNGASASSSKNFNLSGNVTGGKKTIVLPWIAQSRGPLVQSSDLYLHNPGGTDMKVTLEFRQRGLSEANPPKVERTIKPGATLFVADVLRDLFNRENYTGFVNITQEQGSATPVITSFNTTFANDGQEFGQTVPAVSLSSTSAATSGSAMQYLVGLNDNSERVAYFGVTNPTDQPATYRLKFFDSDGKPVGKGDYQLTLSRFGQKQYQPKDLRDVFGVHDVDDFRVQIETTSGGRLFPYGASIRVGSEDPSYIGTGTQSDAKVFLVGALATKGLNESLWQTDLVIANTTSEVILTELTFTGTGVTAVPTPAVKLTLQPGETRRLANVLEQWGLTKAVGVLTLDSDAPGGVFPLIQGESYENTRPTRRFGQSMPALTLGQAAGAGQGQYLVGLRQNEKNRTTLWVFNPGDQAGDYDVIYRDLDGKELGRIATKLGPGKLRQISPNQHPLPKAGVTGGFTVQVVVKGGKVLAAAQVINNVTNDPAYIQGETR
jgi:PKD repeat protein